MFVTTITNLFTAIGWALLNSIWQMGLLYLLATVCTRLFFKTSTARHTIFVAAFITGCCWFLLSLFSTPQVALGIGANTQQLFEDWKKGLALLNTTIPYLTIAYLCWVGICIFRLAHVYTTNLNQHKTHWQKLPAQWRLYIQQQSQRLGVKAKINAFISNYIDTPQVIGVLKPVILLPASCLTYLSPQQLEAVLLHEIAHIKRNDFALNVFIIIMEILFFFNPFARKIAAAIRKEREFSCDDWVLQFQYKPALYAAALLQLEKNRCNQALLGIAAISGNQQQLLLRVKRIAGLPLPANNKKAGLLSVALIFIVAALLVFSPAPPKIILAAGVNNTNYVNTNAVRTYTSKPVINNTPVNHYLREKIKPVASAYTDDAVFNQLRAVSNKAGLNLNPSFVNLAREEAIDYSLEEPLTEIPDEVLNKLSDAPFVPSSSFNYQFIEDTLLPEQEKNLLIAETEALHHARIAIENMRWETVAKELKFSAIQVKQLKELLLSELAQADIEKAKLVLTQQQAAAVKMATTYQQQQVLTNQYRQQQAILETLQNKMRQEQQQLERLKDKQQSDLKQLESEHKKLQQTARKKRIIYI